MDSTRYVVITAQKIINMRRTARFATPSLGAGVATGGTVETVTGLCSVVGCALRSASLDLLSIPHVCAYP